MDCTRWRSVNVARRNTVCTQELRVRWRHSRHSSTTACLRCSARSPGRICSTAGPACPSLGRNPACYPQDNIALLRGNSFDGCKAAGRSKLPSVGTRYRKVRGTVSHWIPTLLPRGATLTSMRLRAWNFHRSNPRRFGKILGCFLPSGSRGESAGRVGRFLLDGICRRLAGRWGRTSVVVGAPAWVGWAGCTPCRVGAPSASTRPMRTAPLQFLIAIGSCIRTVRTCRPELLTKKCYFITYFLTKNIITD